MELADQDRYFWLINGKRSWPRYRARIDNRKGITRGQAVGEWFVNNIMSLEPKESDLMDISVEFFSQDNYCPDRFFMKFV